MVTEYNPDTFYQLANGKVVMDERQARMLYTIKSIHPEKSDPLSIGFEWSEMGMGDLFAECYKDDTRYCLDNKTWYTYAEGRWQKDTGGALVDSKIKEFVRILVTYAAEILDDDVRKKWLEMCLKMNDRRFRNRMLDDARSECRIESVAFDAHPNLINCRNGTFDLNTMTFRGHDWRDLLTMQTNFSYPVGNVFQMPTERIPVCERWDRFISEVMSGDKEKERYLQKALGYALLGDAP